MDKMPEDVAVERTAQIITKWLGYSWGGLGEGSVVAKGFPVFTHGQFGWGFQGRKDDMRNLAREILADRERRQPVAEPVAVKPLKWRKPDDDELGEEEMMLVSAGVGGNYSISRKQSVGPAYLLWWAQDPCSWPTRQGVSRHAKL